jgi:hypothetical protein
MVHTQPTQNNNNRPCALFCTKIHFVCFPAMAMAMAMALCGFMRG